MPSSSKVLFKLVFMAPFIVVLATQRQNIKMRSSKHIIKVATQKVMATMVLNIDFMTLNILKLDEFFIKLREALENLYKKHHLIQFYHILKKIETITCSIYLLAHYLHISSKICRLFLKKIIVDISRLAL